MTIVGPDCRLKNSQAIDIQDTRQSSFDKNRQSVDLQSAIAYASSLEPWRAGRAGVTLVADSPAEESARPLTVGLRG
jgi:hypothetical protein